MWVQYIPGSNTRRTAGSLLLRENANDGGKNMATQVIVEPLLSADPNTDNVLVRRFCVAFSSVSGTASSLNPLFLRSLSTVCPLASHSISSATAVHVKFAVALTAILTDFGGTTIPVVYSRTVFL